MTASLTDLSWPLHSDRLLIRPATAADVEAVWTFRRLPDVSAWLTVLPASLDAFRDRYLAAHRLASTLVVERDGTIIGDLMVRIEAAWAQVEVEDHAAATQAELGWVLHPDHVGHGYATEAVSALLGACFDGLGLRRVVAYCFAANTASWALMERLGMRREQHGVLDSLHRSGEWMDGYGYALLADEWRAAQESTRGAVGVDR